MKVTADNKIYVTLGDPRWNGDRDGGGERTFALSVDQAIELRNALSRQLLRVESERETNAHGFHR